MTNISNSKTANKFDQDQCFATSIPPQTVTIPAVDEHEGYKSITVALPWVCIFCGGQRGEPKKGLSYDGSRRMVVDLWENPCGHVEKYSDVRVFITKYSDQLWHLQQVLKAQQEVS